VLLLATALPALAAEGRKEIFQQTTLTGAEANGNFFVSRDITVSDPALAVIEIVGTGVENCEIDLNGFTLAHSNAAAAKPVVLVTNVRSFTVRNGSLAGASTSQDGLSVIGASSAEDRAVIEDVKVSGGDDGIFLDNVTNFLIQRNLIIAPDASGIEISDTDAAPTTLTGLIASNVVRDVNDGTGIRVKNTNDSVTIRGNHVVSESPIDPVGIYVESADGLIVEGNNVSGGGTGIKVKNSEQCRVADNVVSEGNFSGLELENADDCLVLRNVFSSNDFYGILLSVDSDRNHLERNNCSNNTLQGIQIDEFCEANTYGRNTLRRNDPTQATTCTDGGVPSPCGNPAVCDETGLPNADVKRNRSFGDNMNDAGGC
jgi:parallel beta-helix repeat protein